MVYFLWVADAIKIGFSTKPLSRLSTLSTAIGQPIRFFASARGTVRDEWKVHTRLKQQRLKGEWFKANKFVIDVMFTYLQEEAEQMKNAHELKTRISI